MTKKSTDFSKKSTKIIRTDNKKRMRPVQSQRFIHGDNFDIEDLPYSKNDDGLQWLGMNYKKMAGKIPSLTEIQEGIISYLINNLIAEYDKVLSED